MGKAGLVVLGAVIIGTILGVVLSATYGLPPTGGLPLLCGLVGLIASLVIVNGVDLIRKRSALRPPVGVKTEERPPEIAAKP